MSLIAELKRRNGQNVVVTVGFRVASLTGFPAFPVPSLSPLGMAVLLSLLELASWQRLRS